MEQSIQEWTKENFWIFEKSVLEYFVPNDPIEQHITIYIDEVLGNAA